MARTARQAVTLGLDGTATAWDLATGKQVRLPCSDYIDLGRTTETAQRTAPDGSHLLLAAGDNTARLWDLQSGQVVLTLAGTPGSGHVCRDQRRRQDLLATASADGTARLWDAATGKERLTLAGHAGGGHALALSPDGPAGLHRQRRTTARPLHGMPRQASSCTPLAGNRRRLESRQLRSARTASKSPPASSTRPFASGMMPATSSTHFSGTQARWSPSLSARTASTWRAGARTASRSCGTRRPAKRCSGCRDIRAASWASRLHRMARSWSRRAATDARGSADIAQGGSREWVTIPASAEPGDVGGMEPGRYAHRYLEPGRQRQGVGRRERPAAAGSGASTGRAIRRECDL